MGGAILSSCERRGGAKQQPKRAASAPGPAKRGAAAKKKTRRPDQGIACDVHCRSPSPIPEPQPPLAPRPRPFTLAVDIGGSSIKASVLDAAGGLAAPHIRSPTPKRQRRRHPGRHCGAGGTASLGSARVGWFSGGGEARQDPDRSQPRDRVLVRLRPDWAISSRFGVPARVLNDAAVQGLGVVQGQGLSCVLTLGTGVGCALFHDRHLLQSLELANIVPARARHTIDTSDRRPWRRGAPALEPEGASGDRTVTKLTPATCSISGAATREDRGEPPGHVKIVSNTAGITGGVRLWEPSSISISRPIGKPGPARAGSGTIMKALTSAAR